MLFHPVYCFSTTGRPNVHEREALAFIIQQKNQNIRTYFPFIYLVSNIHSFPDCHVNSIQDTSFNVKFLYIKVTNDNVHGLIIKMDRFSIAVQFPWPCTLGQSVFLYFVSCEDIEDIEK